jgi:hypothetical protein
VALVLHRILMQSKRKAGRFQHRERRDAVCATPNA